MVISYVVKVLILTSFTSAFFVNLKKLGEGLERKYNLEFLKSFLKFPVYINPHPHCALEDEDCTMDNNCCGGLECKMAVDREGIRYTCQERIEEAENGKIFRMEEEEGEEGFDQDLMESDNSNSLLEEIYRTRVEELNREDQRLANDQYLMIKELQKPLSLDEMRELKQVNEIEDYKRENELNDLRDWANKTRLEEEQQKITKRKLEKLAAERVSKVLKEEEKQKVEMFKKIKEEMKNKKSWF